MFKELKKLWSLGFYELNVLRNRCYPDFVFDSSIKVLRDEIPVFLFHSVKADDFEEKLIYLVENNYQTIGADELYDYLIGRKRNPINKVVLTFDDGRGSLWTVAYPLLKKYGLVGVAFIVPSWVMDDNKYCPNLDDYWKGHTSLQELENRELNSNPVVTWAEVQEMHRSGNIDFQSHTLNHTLIFTSDNIVDFVNPAFNLDFYGVNIPQFRVNGRDNFNRNPEMGMPIYTTAPLASPARRYFDDEALREACILHVKANGERGFFSKRNWRKELYELVKKYKWENNLNHRYETDLEKEERLLYEFKESKESIERYLRKPINHFCYPWFAGSDLSVELSKQAGYLTNLWGWNIPGRRTNRLGDDPYRIVRLPGDYIFRLPGKGRRSLSSITALKVLRNIKNLKKRVSIRS